MTGIFSFPNPVNEVAARLVAGGVASFALVALVLNVHWILALLAYGFVARTLSGPTLSPLGTFVTRVLTPRLPFAEKPVAGPPKRFAQAIGATLSLLACALGFGFGLWNAAWVLVAMIVFAASLESLFALCIGCRLFALLISAGLIPERICAECANFTLRA